MRRTVSLVGLFKQTTKEENRILGSNEASKKGSIANKHSGSVHDKEKEIKKTKSSPEVDPDRKKALQEFLDEKVRDMELEETRRDGADDKPLDNEEVEKSGDETGDKLDEKGKEGEDEVESRLEDDNHEELGDKFEDGSGEVSG